MSIDDVPGIQLHRWLVSMTSGCGIQPALAIQLAAQHCWDEATVRAAIAESVAFHEHTDTEGVTWWYYHEDLPRSPEFAAEVASWGDPTL